MFPYYCVLLPAWFVCAIVYPIFQSFHALQEKSAERKTWLFYWVAYMLASWFAFYFDWVVRFPFWLLAFYVDIYYEVQLVLIIYLVFPTTMGIKDLLNFLEKERQTVEKVVTDQAKVVAGLVRGKLLKAE
eukprot:TRINITY_DN17255_c0_g1_i1.p1 TRINITY_DN17255_c0_g1~~TRINITY_DN17255_c0_g1_i1.p1  ORF type:complete len:130 (+),score=28.96 TRINITY_DN17255_c0_g1_i1:105-494(+)